MGAVLGGALPGCRFLAAAAENRHSQNQTQKCTGPVPVFNQKSLRLKKKCPDFLHGKTELFTP